MAEQLEEGSPLWDNQRQLVRFLSGEIDFAEWMQHREEYNKVSASEFAITVHDCACCNQTFQQT